MSISKQDAKDLWDGLGRAALVGMVFTAFVFGLAAFEDSDPEGVEAVDETITVVDIGSTSVTALDPLAVIIIAWTVTPFLAVVYRFYRFHTTESDR